MIRRIGQSTGLELRVKRRTSARKCFVPFRIIVTHRNYSTFTLVTGTTVGIVLVIIFAISLLYSVGSEELPNVLTGGIVHAKRD